MNSPQLIQFVAQYRAGLEAEMKLLHRLEAIAMRQRETSEQGDLAALAEVSDQRDRVMAGLVTIEHELKPIRMALLEGRKSLEGLNEFQEVAAMHREAAELVERIVTSDRVSLDALKEAELARRFASQTVNQGETTLNAYRRVVAPPIEGPNLFTRKG